MSSTGSSISLRTWARTNAATSPTPTPPPAAAGSRRRRATRVTLLVMAAIAVFSATSAVASLTRLSPSRIVTILRGMPTRRATALAATASGGATTAPSANAAASGMPGHHATRRPARRRPC